MANVKGMKTVPPVNRLQGSLPKIGIRPAIDGRRRGVRESLEGQTMAMAKATADLIGRSLRHPCGLPVECVIADTCIGGAAEAARAAEKFRREGVGVSITVTPCWCYGAETMDMDPLTPKAVWGFNGTERPGAVYLAAVLAAHAQKGLPAFGIYGRDVQDRTDGSIPADVQEKLLRFARAGLAAATMRGASYLAVGGVSMGIAGSIVDPALPRALPRPALRDGGHLRVHPAHRRGHLRSRRVQARPGLGEGELPGGPRQQREGGPALPGGQGPGVGDGREDDHDRPRPDDRATRASRSSASARRRSATTRSPRASRASGSGPTTSPTATSSRRC